MTDLGYVLIATIIIWQTAVTIVLLVLLRQVTILSVRTGLAGPAQSEASLSLGQPLPDSLLEAAPTLKGAGVVHYVTWLTGTCMSCKGFAEALVLSQQHGDFSAPIVAVVSGSDAGAQQIAAQLSGVVKGVVTDPVASAAIDQLGLDVSPLAIEVESQVVTGWAAITSMDDLRRLCDARSHSDASKWASTQPMGVVAADHERRDVPNPEIVAER